MAPSGLLHLLAAAVALVAGAAVLLGRKGTRRHRRLGVAYVVAMLVLNASALAIYRLSGAFGPFHAAALVSLATVIPGYFTVRAKRPGWLLRHYLWMTFSYAGLIAAAVSEAATRLPSAPFWGAVAAGSALVLLVSAVWIVRAADTTLAPFRRHR